VDNCQIIVRVSINKSRGQHLTAAIDDVSRVCSAAVSHGDDDVVSNGRRATSRLTAGAVDDPGIFD